MQENLETKDITKNIKNDLIESQCKNIKKRKCWTKEEIDNLRHLYETMGLSLSELREKFPNRTEVSIELKIERLKLKHTDAQKSSIWSRTRIGNKNPRYGKPSVLKGYTKYTSDSIKRASEKNKAIIAERIKNGTDYRLSFTGKNNPMYGKPAWSKGMTKDTNDTLKIAGIKNSITNKKRHELMSLEEKTAIKNRMAFIGSKCKKKNTFIETKIQDFLNQIGEEYETNYVRDGFAFDIYIKKYNLIIECQGDYWHMNPAVYKNKTPDLIQSKNIERDLKKLKYLTDNKYQHLFLWEYDIRKNFELVKNQIKHLLCTSN